MEELVRACDCHVGTVNAPDEDKDEDQDEDVEVDEEAKESLRRNIFATRVGVIDEEECEFVIGLAEQHAARRGGWTTGRHYSVPTTDIPVSEVLTTTTKGSGGGERVLLRWFNNVCRTRIFPLLARLYPEYVSAPHMLKVNDAFVVKYEYSARQRHLPLHTDQSVLSLTIALNAATASAEDDDNDEEEEDEEGKGKREESPLELTFSGGGTYFESIGKALVPVRGGLVAFPGDLSHGGQQITGGVRYIIACFLYVHDETAGPK